MVLTKVMIKTAQRRVPTRPIDDTPRRPASDATFTIVPAPAARMRATASCITKRAPKRFTRSMAVRSSARSSRTAYCPSEEGAAPTGDMADLIAALQSNREMSYDSSATPNATEQALLAKVAELGKNAKSEAEITAALLALGAPVAPSGY
jgi:hypothetical protein